MDTSGNPRSRTKWTQQAIIGLGALWAGLILAGSAHSELATADQMQQVCSNWPTRSVALPGPWAGSIDPSISDQGFIEREGQAYYPQGRLDATDSDATGRAALTP
jgi:hypothetical protein